MTTTERARARRWTRGTWAALGAALALAGAALVAAYIRWPIHVGGYCLFALALTLGVYLGRRPQNKRFADLTAAAVAGQQVARDLAELGAVTDRVAAGRCLSFALLATWDDVEDPPSAKDLDDAHSVAAAIMASLDEQGARLTPPRGTPLGDALVEFDRSFRAAGEAMDTSRPPSLAVAHDQEFAAMWPKVDGIGPT